MDYTSRFSAFIDRLSDTGGNPAAGSAGGFNRPRKQPPAHGIHGPQWAADEIERADRQDRVRRGE